MTSSLPGRFGEEEEDREGGCASQTRDEVEIPVPVLSVRWCHDIRTLDDGRQYNRTAKRSHDLAILGTISQPLSTLPVLTQRQIH
jgi:hypothetical protein